VATRKTIHEGTVRLTDSCTWRDNTKSDNLRLVLRNVEFAITGWLSAKAPAPGRKEETQRSWLQTIVRQRLRGVLGKMNPSHYGHWICDKRRKPYE
jgi:hypothetical protein